MREMPDIVTSGNLVEFWAHYIHALLFKEITAAGPNNADFSGSCPPCTMRAEQLRRSFANSLTWCFAFLNCGADHLARNAFYCSKHSNRNGHRRGFLYGSDLSRCLATDQDGRAAVRDRAGVGREE